MLVAEFTISQTTFQEPLDQVPDIEVAWVQTIEQPNGPMQMIVWIESDDFDTVESAIGDDPGVANPELLTEVCNRRLYRVDFTDTGQETNLMPRIIANGGVLKECTGTNDGWRCMAWLPDREAFEDVYQFGRTHDIEFTLHRLFEQTDVTSGSDSLTDGQREMLLEAIESGYLSIPRECTLEELGERLGISPTAASERFRRAVKNLSEQAL